MPVLDPHKIRPKRDWVVVKDDPRPNKTAGGIFLPGMETGVEKVKEGTGEVISVGPGEKNQALGLEPGQKICYRGFLKHANRIETENDHYFFMASDDILGIVPEGVNVGVFSGRPMVPTERDRDAS